MKKHWLYAAIAAAALLTFAVSDSLRNVISRRRAIGALQSELRQVEAQVTESRDRLTRLQDDPSAYENLVRKELGYLRPGEKEIRFLNK